LQIYVQVYVASIVYVSISSYLCTFNLMLTVQGNVGPEIDIGVRRDLINMRTFHMEQDICYVSCSYVMETTKTPTSKSTGKRLAASLEGLYSINIEGEEISTTK